jgi:ketosteroid isomerase-like protein
MTLHWNDSRADSMGHWLELIADEVEWRSLADGAPGMDFAGCCNCKDEVLSYFEKLGADWEMLHYTVGEFIAQGDRVVMVGTCGWRHRGTGKGIESPKVDVIRMKDGKIVGFHEFYDTAKAIAATQ